MKQSFIKQIGIFTLTLVFTLTLFTACHRGTGCPGSITYEAQKNNSDQDC
ncbi:MAG: hypothetical protein IPM47_14595 [Sphingobacteriales bacterium]|nr:MAG: hypothetical protein IPM47_14595 [Sphingobacteriales bacterium]